MKEMFQKIIGKNKAFLFEFGLWIRVKYIVYK